MSSDQQRDQSPSEGLWKVIGELLDAGTIAVVVTLMTGTNSVGSKLLVDETGKVLGSLGNPELDSLVTSHALKVLKTNDETRTIAIKEFAPEYAAT